MTQKILLDLSCAITFIVLLLSCNGSGKSGNPEKFIGIWQEVGNSKRNSIKIERFGVNFTVTANIQGNEKNAASYNKEFDKLIVKGEYDTGTEIIYNSKTNTILAWGGEYEKLNCTILKNCKLQVMDFDTTHYILINKNSLISYQSSGKNNFKSKLNWLNDCEYDITITEVNDTHFQTLLGDVVNMKIEKIEQDVVYFINTHDGRSSMVRYRILK